MSNDEPERSFEIHYSLFLALCSFVRVEGLEPPCLAASDPKSDTSTNFATPALFSLKFHCSKSSKRAIKRLNN